MTISTLLLIGGICHFGILFASALTPRVLDWRGQLAPLSPLLRHLIWVHGIFIVLVIFGFGVISVFNAPSLASGSPLARWFCGFIAVFWGCRLLIQLFLFDARPYLRTATLTIGYHSLTVVFTCLTLVYATAALTGLRA